jgi:hypothetical protein
MPIALHGSLPQAVTPRRPFRLLDSMILVAAIAAGCSLTPACARSAQHSVDHWWLKLVKPEDLIDWLVGAPLALSLLVIPLTAMVMLALIPIRLVGPRPEIRRLVRQPGLNASCALAVAALFSGLPVAAGALVARLSPNEFFSMLLSKWLFLSGTMYGGAAIMASWLTLFVGGRWRAQASWVDRLGRAMAVFWLLVAIWLWAALSYFGAFYGQGFGTRIPDGSRPGAVGHEILTLVSRMMPLVAAVALALVPMSLLGTKRRLRRLARQPGIMASWAGGFAITLSALSVAVLLWVVATSGGLIDFSWEQLSGWILDEDVVTSVTTFGGLAILVSWMTLWMGDRWRPRRSWVDRLGRAVGVCWIVAALAVEIGRVLVQTDYVRLGTS